MLTLITKEEITVALVASWGALCLDTALTETYFHSKGRNFGNTSLSSPSPLVVISYLYFELHTIPASKSVCEHNSCQFPIQNCV